MTETIRYSLVAKEDLAIGTGNLEVRLGDGRVVILTKIQVTDFLSSLSIGSVVFIKTGGVVGEDASNLFWDATNRRLGVGTASPSQPLHVVGIILSEANLTFQSGTSFVGTLDHSITADRTWTLPDSTDTVALLALAQTLTNKTILAPSNTVTGILDRDVTTADVVNTITETTVYTFSVPGGTLGTANALRLTLVGDFLNSDAATTDTFTVRVKYGATTIGTIDIDLADVSGRRTLGVFTMLSANNATNAQVAYTRREIGSGAAGSTGGTADGNLTIDASMHNAIAVDSTVAQTLVVTFQHSLASANKSARALAVQLEVLR